MRTGEIIEESEDMDFGFGLPTRGPLSSPEHLVTLAQRGEEMGFDIISVSDHVVIPKRIDSRYPYSETGEFAGGDSGACLEQLTTLSFLANATSSVRLLTSVMVLPHRSPVLTAKMLASIDVLSRGRLNVGCGVGWMREEFEALGAPPYDERGAVGDEYIRAFKELWTSDAPSFDGTYCRFSDISFLPKPVQQPHPPIWIGGESPPALRRAARLGDVWYTIGNKPRFTVRTPAEYSASVVRLRRSAEEAGRDPSTLGLAYSAGWLNDREAQTLPNGERRILTGTPDQVADDIKSFADIGVRHFMSNFQSDTLEATLARMERFATTVRPRVQS
jgi:probable F420-dependent oxidoreductase